MKHTTLLNSIAIICLVVALGFVFDTNKKQNELIENLREVATKQQTQIDELNKESGQYLAFIQKTICDKNGGVLYLGYNLRDIDQKNNIFFVTQVEPWDFTNCTVGATKYYWSTEGMRFAVDSYSYKELK